MTHTPGPWIAKERITEPSNHGKYSVYNSAENEYIGSCDAYLNGHHDADKNHANARLIAAAPELLIELEYIVEMLAIGAMPSGSDITNGRAAVKKATEGS